MADIGRFTSFLGIFLVVLVFSVGENEVNAKPNPCFFDLFSDLYDYASDYSDDDDSTQKPKPQRPQTGTVVQSRPGQAVAAVGATTTPKAGATTTTAKPAGAAKTTAAGTTAKPAATTAAAAKTTKKK